jgi:hypothetical protein
MDHLFEQKLVRENQQLQLELTKLNKQIKQLQEKVVGYEQVLSQLDEGEKRNRRLAASLAKQGDIAKVGTAKIAAMDSYLKGVAEKQGGEAANAADSALWRQRGQIQRDIKGAETKATKVKAGLDTGLKAVTKSRVAREARGTFSDKPKLQAQADRVKSIGINTAGTNLGPHSSNILASQGKLPIKKFGATPAEQKQTLANLRSASAAKGAERAELQSYAAKARNKAK